MNVDAAVAQLRTLLSAPGAPLSEVRSGTHGPKPPRERRRDGDTLTFLEGFRCDMRVGLVRALSLRKCRLHVTADVHREALVAIAGVEKADIGGNQPVQLREDLEGVVSADWSRFVAEHRLDEVIETVLRVGTVDVEDALTAIEVHREQRVISGTK